MQQRPAAPPLKLCTEVPAGSDPLAAAPALGQSAAERAGFWGAMSDFYIAVVPPRIGAFAERSEIDRLTVALDPVP